MLRFQHLNTFQISRFRKFKVSTFSRFQDPRISRCQHFNMLKFSTFNIRPRAHTCWQPCQHWQLRTPLNVASWNVENCVVKRMLKYWHCWNVEISTCWNVETIEMLTSWPNCFELNKGVVVSIFQHLNIQTSWTFQDFNISTLRHFQHHNISRFQELRHSNSEAHKSNPQSGGYSSLRGHTFWNYKVIASRKAWVVRIVRKERLENKVFREKL